jgi:cytochrome c oxidase subunit 1
MLLFSIPTHLTGMMGMPRRVFDASYAGSAVAESWKVWTFISSIGGIILFVSAMFFVMVMVGTALAGRRYPQEPIAFAEPIEDDRPPRLLDRLGLWTLVAIALIVAAYAMPIYHLLTMPGPGSPPQTPF